MKGDLHLRIPKDLKDSLINIAENDSRSLSNLVKLILTEYVYELNNPEVFYRVDK